MQKTSSASSAACVRFVEAVSICLVSWDLFFGASHFCSFETVDLASFYISEKIFCDFLALSAFFMAGNIKVGVIGLGRPKGYG